MKITFVSKKGGRDIIIILIYPSYSSEEGPPSTDLEEVTKVYVREKILLTRLENTSLGLEIE